MAVLINRKICDNAQECGGIEVCPNSAIYWDNEESTIAINNDQCVSCFACEDACPVGAIRVAETDSDYKRIEQEINDDHRTIDELFVDRYGAMPLDDKALIDESEYQNIVSNSSGLIIIECFVDDSIQCLAHSITINQILSWFPQCPHYYKMCCNNGVLDIVNEYPALLVFRNGKYLGKVSGVFEVFPENDDFSQEDRLKEKLIKLL